MCVETACRNPLLELQVGTGPQLRECRHRRRSSRECHVASQMWPASARSNSGRAKLSAAVCD
eukprot:8502426-Alexandrium_andersonii.AAC.1